MSNRNDNDFNDFDDFFDDDDKGRVDFDDDDFPSGLGDADESEMPNIDERDERGTNPAFIILAILMIILFVVGLGVVLFLATRDTGPTELELSATAVVQFNETQMAFQAQTQTQSAIEQQLTQTAAFESLFLTQTALAASPTPTDTPTRPPTLTPTPSPNPDELTATALIANVLTREVLSLTPPNLTETAAALTLTALNFTATPTNTPTETSVAPTDLPTLSPTAEPTLIVTSPLDVVNQTATAIAGAFLTATANALEGQGGGVVVTLEPPTPEFGTPLVTPQPGVTPVATALPDTGLFDDVIGGSGDGMGLLALAVFGLIGVIFVSRRLRSNGRKDSPANTPSDQPPGTP
jgi:hypothetical protein